jgi:hypothetical protein
MNMSIRFVFGDIRDTTAEYILQQVNCLCVNSHGLSQSLEQTFPYCRTYSGRRRVGRRNLAVPEDRGTPGKCVIFTPPRPMKGPKIACLQAQWDFGKPGMKTNRPVSPECDTLIQRQLWLNMALRDFTHQVPQRVTVAVPWKMGCGLAGGDLTSTLDIVIDWGSRNEYNLIFHCI